MREINLKKFKTDLQSTLKILDEFTCKKNNNKNIVFSTLLYINDITNLLNDTKHFCHCYQQKSNNSNFILMYDLLKGADFERLVSPNLYYELYRLLKSISDKCRERNILTEDFKPYLEEINPYHNNEMETLYVNPKDLEVEKVYLNESTRKDLDELDDELFDKFKYNKETKKYDILR